MKVKFGRPVVWPDIRKTTGALPFGYIETDDPEILIPDPEKKYEVRGEKLSALELRDFAVRLAKSGNYTKAALVDWFSAAVGKKYAYAVLFTDRHVRNKRGKRLLVGRGLLTDAWRKSVIRRSVDGRFTDAEEGREAGTEE